MMLKTIKHMDVDRLVVVAKLLTGYIKVTEKMGGARKGTIKLTKQKDEE